VALQKIKKTKMHLDQIRGSLLGGAVGDALGYPVEFLEENELFFRYGEKGIQEYELDDLSGKALISDDTQMTLFTANGILVADTRASINGIGRVIAAVNHKGDSDSTGAVTGNILGALIGYNAIDAKWKENLELANVILEMADDLYHGCQMNEYHNYQDSDWIRKYIHMQWKGKMNFWRYLNRQNL